MEKRLQNRRDHLLHRHIETVVPRLGRLARANGWNHLLVAGETKAASALMNRLNSDLRQLKVHAGGPAGAVRCECHQDVPAGEAG